MTVLNRFYVSGGDDVRLITMQIEIAGDVANGIDPVSHYLVHEYDPLEARLETGELVTFEPFAMAVAMPARNLDGTQDLNFSLANISGLVSAEIQRALANRLKMFATMRQYLVSDLSAPADRPYRLEIKNGQWSPMQADLTAGYMNILDTGWPRRLYTLNEFPGLRYIT
jgi:hypothetical protein